jgi:2-C-methyl-D-erythritol 4-phosphate cytidylyltransferase
MQKFVLIVAGGVGSRFKSETPKQFAKLHGRPVLMNTFEAFSFLDDLQFILVLPKNLIDDWKSHCQKHNFEIDHKIAEGGPKRFHSVKSGLSLVPDDCLIAIHDGVRPLVSKETIQRCFDLAQRKKSAVPVIPIHDSLRQLDGLFSKAVNRDEFKIVQTPQVFYASQIKKAYQQNFDLNFTDDVGVFESAGHRVYLTEGNPENIKITGPVDLIIAENLIGLQSGEE